MVPATMEELVTGRGWGNAIRERSMGALLRKFVPFPAAIPFSFSMEYSSDSVIARSPSFVLEGGGARSLQRSFPARRGWK